jgi:hypothetical protein
MYIRAVIPTLTFTYSIWLQVYCTPPFPPFRGVTLVRVYRRQQACTALLSVHARLMAAFHISRLTKVSTTNNLANLMAFGQHDLLA